MAKAICALLLAGTCCIGQAFAAPPQWGAMLKGFSAVGCDVQETPEGRAAKILVLCNQDKVIAAVPELKMMGLLNPDLSQTTINMMPGMVATSFMMEVVSSMIDPYYKSHSSNLTMWEADLVIANDYGHLQRMPIFGFRFTRALDSQVNWDNMDFQRLEKIAPGFHLYPGATGLLSGEN